MTPRKPRVCVIDDKASVRKLLATLLAIDYDVDVFGDPTEALGFLERQQVEVVVSDIRMPGITGLDVLGRLKAWGHDAEVVLITAYGTVKQAVEAVKLGAFDYLTKPFEPEELALVVGRAAERRGLRAHARALTRELEARGGRPRLIGRSAETEAVRRLIDKAAPLDVTVLLCGATGTGKEVAARELHARSPRRAGPFVVVHCAGVPRDLVESELFGHVKGAFSGATERKRGLAEEAAGGTLFLDDVNYLDLDLQAKVNRLVQDKEVKPVGATAWQRVDARLIAAANVDLEEAVRERRFREDLYYRLNVFAIRLAPLDQRRDDIPELAEHFFAEHRARLGKPDARLTPGALDALRAASWPGNVRQLENAVERALILADGVDVGVEAFLPAPRSAAVPAGAEVDLTYAEAIERATTAAARRYLSAVLARFDHNVTRAAEHAGVARQHFHRLLQRFEVARGAP